MGLNVIALSVALFLIVITSTEGSKLEHMDLQKGKLTEEDSKKEVDIDINNEVPNGKDVFDVAMKREDGNRQSPIILTEEQRKIISGEISHFPFLEFAKRWTRSIGLDDLPFGHIPYTISSEMTSCERAAIMAAMHDISKYSCITFGPKKSTDRDFIHIINDQRSWSYVGKIGGNQSLSLDLGCTEDAPRRGGGKGMAIRFLMYALGFVPTQLRPDRDKFVKIFWANIIPGYETYFQKLPERCIDQLLGPYDYDSVMHDSSHAFSANGKRTILSIKDPLQKLGQLNGLTTIDKDRLTKKYVCHDPRIRYPCTTVDILHTKHWRDGDNGRYFYFDEKDFNNMVNRTYPNNDWNGRKFKIIQKGSHSWSGTVIVWKGNSKSGAHGRRNSKSRPGQWASGDSIKLWSCADQYCRDEYWCRLAKTGSWAELFDCSDKEIANKCPRSCKKCPGQ